MGIDKIRTPGARGTAGNDRRSHLASSNASEPGRSGCSFAFLVDFARYVDNRRIQSFPALPRVPGAPVRFL